MLEEACFFLKEKIWENIGIIINFYREILSLFGCFKKKVKENICFWKLINCLSYLSS